MTNPIPLRASQKCYRYAHFEHDGRAKFVIEGRDARLRKAMGSAFEEPFWDDLEEYGPYPIVPHDQGIELAYESDGVRMAGHPDGWWISLDDELAVLTELKTTADKHFATARADFAQGRWQRYPLADWLRQVRRYIALAQVTGFTTHSRNIDPCDAYLIVVSRDTLQHQLMRFMAFPPGFDHAKWLEIEMRPLRGGEPPIPESFTPAAPPCLECEFQHICWTNYAPETTDSDYATLGDEWAAADVTLKFAQADMRDIKRRVREKMDASGAKRVRVHRDYVARISTGKARATADWKRIRADGVEDRYNTALGKSTTSFGIYRQENKDDQAPDA